MTHRWFLYSAIAGILVAGFFLVRSLGEHTIYYRYPSEALAQRADFPDDRRFRLAGVIEPGTLARTPAGHSFVVGDGEASIPVELVSTPPPLFDEDVEVLLDGAWHGDVFVADDALIRHEENYEAPPAGADLPAG